MRELFIIRGLPSSGKSTLAHTIADVVCEADSYFYVYEDPETGILHRHYHDGEYRFEPELRGKAHEECKLFCEDRMACGIERIAVSNTFTQEWEMKPYFKLAEQYGYRVYSIIVENRHGNKNEHAVPDETVEAMRDRFQIKL